MPVVLKIRVDNVDMVAAMLNISRYIEEKRFCRVITLNPEIIWKARRDASLRELISTADMVTPDGHGVVWAGRKLGQPMAERVTGIDLLQEICRLGGESGWRVFLLGGEKGVAEEAAKNITGRYPGITVCGTADGYFKPAEEDALLETIRNAQPQVLFVGMGAPGQDFWIARHGESLGSLVAMGVGGSLDVLSGRVKRAPAVWQKLRLEWLWRVIRDPRRIKRVAVLPLFTLKVLAEARRINRGKGETAEPMDEAALERYRRRRQK